MRWTGDDPQTRRRHADRCLARWHDRQPAERQHPSTSSSAASALDHVALQMGLNLRPKGGAPSARPRRDRHRGNRHRLALRPVRHRWRLHDGALPSAGTRCPCATPWRLLPPAASLSPWRQPQLPLCGLGPHRSAPSGASDSSTCRRCSASRSPAPSLPASAPNWHIASPRRLKQAFAPADAGGGAKFMLFS